MELYLSILKVRPAAEHPIAGWQFGWLVVFLFGPSKDAAESRAATITDNLPYEVVNTFGTDPLVGTALAAVAVDPPPELKPDFERAEASARCVGVGFVLVPAKEGLDEQDFTAQVRRLC